MIFKTDGRFGATGITGADCPAGGSWDVWCDCMYPASADPALNAKCRGKPMSFLTLAPWTDVGAVQRGLPKEIDPLTQGLLSAAGIKPQISPGAPQAAAATRTTVAAAGIMGLSQSTLWVGGAVLALGVGALLYSRRR